MQVCEHAATRAHDFGPCMGLSWGREAGLQGRPGAPAGHLQGPQHGAPGPLPGRARATPRSSQCVAVEEAPTACAGSVNPTPLGTGGAGHAPSCNLRLSLCLLLVGTLWKCALPGYICTFLRICRCLERRLLEHRVAMAGPAAAGAAAVDGPLAAAAVDVRHPDPEELQRVAAVVGEADTNPDYWFLASKDGSREGHYRWVGLGARWMREVWG